jgi:hypothetical protein
MLPPNCSTPAITQVVQVSRSDRWFIHQRLQELMIPSWCLEDGSLQVEIHSTLDAMLVHSTIRQFTAPRNELVSWLENCWRAIHES